MSDSIRQAKRRLRVELGTLRASLTEAERDQASRRACAVLMASDLWGRAQSVALFHSMSDEVSTLMLLRSAWRTGRRVALPVTPSLGEPLEFRWVTPSTPLVRAHYGALEPGPTAARSEHADLDLVIVPGLGFDARGARLGYGGGYYDRTLRSAGPAIMLAFACQRVATVPEEEHDVRVRGVATETGWMSPVTNGDVPGGAP